MKLGTQQNRTTTDNVIPTSLIPSMRRRQGEMASIQPIILITEPLSRNYPAKNSPGVEEDVEGLPFFIFLRDGSDSIVAFNRIIAH